jgi:hypothetical protein
MFNFKLGLPWSVVVDEPGASMKFVPELFSFHYHLQRQAFCYYQIGWNVNKLSGAFRVTG